MGELKFKTPRLKAGSALWIAFNQIKRDFSARNAKGAQIVITYIFLAAFLLTICAAGGQIVKVFYTGDFKIGYGFYLAAGNKLIMMFLGLLFMSIMTSFQYFSDRGDLDLLLSSPIKPEIIANSRLIVSTLRTTSMFLFFGTMFIAYTAITLKPILFSYIPVALGLALIEGGVTYIFARGLLIKFGLVAGRRIAQTMGTSGIVLGVWYMQTSTSGIKSKAEIFAYDGTFSFIDNTKAWFGEAVLGNWLNALIILLVGMVCYAIFMFIISKDFASDAAIISGQSEIDNKKTKVKSTLKFSKNNSAFKAIVKKEILTMTRDSTAIMQVVIPIATLIPFFYIINTNDDTTKDVMKYIVPPMIIMLTASISASVAWLVASVEEAGDLLKSSPASYYKIYLYKGFVAFLPALLEIIIISLAIAKLGLFVIAVTILFALLANLSAIFIEFANIRPSKRPKMMQKPERSFIGILYSMLVMAIWAGTSVVAMFNIAFALIPFIAAIILTIVIVYFSRPNPEVSGAQNVVVAAWQSSRLNAANKEAKSIN